MFDIFLVFAVQRDDGLNDGQNNLYDMYCGPRSSSKWLEHDKSLKCNMKFSFRKKRYFVAVFFPSLLVIRNLLQFFWKRCRDTWYMAAHIFLLNPNLIDLQQNSFLVTGESNKQKKRRKCLMYKNLKIHGIKVDKTQGKIDLRNESGRPMKVKVVGEVSEKWN